MFFESGIGGVLCIGEFDCEDLLVLLLRLDSAEAPLFSVIAAACAAAAAASLFACVCDK